MNLASLYAALGGRIDWKRIAFQKVWLKNMANLFRELGVPVSLEKPSMKQLREALIQTKKRSEGFKKFLELQLGEDASHQEQITRLQQSDQGGCLEFLLFRLIGYGRRKVRIEKHREALNQLEIAPEEKEMVLAELERIEHGNGDYWKSIQGVERKIQEGIEASGKLISYKADFSKKNGNGNGDRGAAFKYAEQLLHQNEFGLSLVRSLDENSFSDIDLHNILDVMVPYFIQTGKTVAPHFIRALKRIDHQIDRYHSFWHYNWPEPSHFLQEKALAFHGLVEREGIYPFTVLTSPERVYSSRISELFFSFPVVRKFLNEPDGSLGVGKLLMALYYFNPQLVGVILRSSQNNLLEARQAFSSFSR